MELDGELQGLGAHLLHAVIKAGLQYGQHGLRRYGAGRAEQPGIDDLGSQHQPINQPSSYCCILSKRVRALHLMASFKQKRQLAATLATLFWQPLSSWFYARRTQHTQHIYIW